MSLPRILVTGANGQVGRELQAIAAQFAQYKFDFYGSGVLDITSPDSIQKAFNKGKIDFVINCAAFTAVDKAEEESLKAFEVNAEALKLLGDFCTEYRTVLIHLSSDYVYDSLCDRALKEGDPTEPKSVYAKSKLEGEKRIKQFCERWIIIRTSWVYSSFGNNFVKTMLRLGQERDELDIVFDQIGAPTYATDIANIIMKFVVEIDKRDGNDPILNEIYNFSNKGITTWDAFAKKIFDLSDIDCTVKGITTEQFGAKAPRPLWSVLSKEKIKSALNVEIQSWESALKQCLQLLKVKG